MGTCQGGDGTTTSPGCLEFCSGESAAQQSLGNATDVGGTVQDPAVYVSAAAGGGIVFGPPAIGAFTTWLGAQCTAYSGICAALLGVGAKIAANAVNGSEATTAGNEAPVVTVIGRWSANRSLAESIGGNYLNTSMLIWNAMTPAEQTQRNVEWLQEAVIRGDVIRLASRVSEATAGSGFAMELEFFFKAGYTVSWNGQYLIPPVP